MSAPRDVVITGVGVVSPIGIGRNAFWESLRTAQSGVRPITQFDATALPVRIGAEVVDFEPKLYVKPRKSLKVMSREIQLGMASAALAIEDANLDSSSVETDRFGVVYGNPMLYGDVHELKDLYAACVEAGDFVFSRFGGQFPNQLFPLWMLKYLPNMAASHIGIAHGARGPNNSIVLGDVSSLASIIEATTVIQRGLSDVMLAGGSGSRLALAPVMYRGFSHLSQRNDDPPAASRPFDADRDGMVIGEGGGTVVLEARTHAEARGANIIGTVAGYATTHRGQGSMQAAIERTLRGSLLSAGLTQSDIGHVNAHGLSDVSHDTCEASAIRNVLGDTPVTAPKSFFGNLGAAASVLELAASLIAAEADLIPPTLNYEKPDPACDINIVKGQPHPSNGKAVVCLNQTGTGQAVSLSVVTE
jgi:3-oxoacyl-[acyl-carrier-protein] synthase II